MAKLLFLLALVVIVEVCLAHPHEEKHHDKRSHLHKKHGNKRDITSEDPGFTETVFPTPSDAPIGGDAAAATTTFNPTVTNSQWVYYVQNDKIIPVHIEDTNEYIKITGNTTNQNEQPVQNQDNSQNANGDSRSKKHGHYKRFAVVKPADFKKHGHEDKHGHDDKRAHHEKHGHEHKRHGHEDRKLEEEHHHQF